VPGRTVSPLLPAASVPERPHCFCDSYCGNGSGSGFCPLDGLGAERMGDGRTARVAALGAPVDQLVDGH
tara:strand:- start:332 stop:538 length:207 start_codon:yes stop_codon:yes gene_type:complete